MRRVLALAAAVAPLLAGVGCNTARFVERDANGGVVAVPRAMNRDHALKLIEKEYGPNYVIDGEGEFVTGQVTTNTTNQNKQSEFNARNPFRPQEQTTTQTVSQTQDQKEWRITFHKMPAGVGGTPTHTAMGGRTPPGLPPAPRDAGVLPATYQTRQPVAGTTPPGLPPAPAGGGPLQGVVDCTDGSCTTGK